MIETTNLLIIAPHHDDEVIGCGGIIARAAQAGYGVDVVYVTAGYLGVPHVSDVNVAMKMREIEAKQAGTILGVRRQIFLRKPDREFSYSLTIVKELIGIIRSGIYTTICFPHENEGDYEHNLVNQIMKEAVWLARSPYLPELGEPSQIAQVYLYEVWTPISSYHIKIDISDYLSLKANALLAYHSQFTEQQVEGIIGLNKYRAAMTSASIRAAEVFKLMNN